MKCNTCGGQLYAATVTLFNIVGVPVDEDGEFDIFAASSWDVGLDDLYCEACGLIIEPDEDDEDDAS